jgi:predicted amidohydrolase YtcJ
MVVIGGRKCSSSSEWYERLSGHFIKILDMTKVVFHYFLIGCILALLSQKNLFGQSADMVITNGKVFTSDTNTLYVQAIAIKGDKILAAGTNEAILKLASSKTKKIDVQGKTVVPGFNDAHDHPGWEAHIGQSFGAEFSVHGPTRKAVLDSVARLARQAKPHEWVSGLIGTTVFSDTAMRDLLDRVAPHNPVQLQVMWGHGLVLNSYALKMLRIADDEPDPLGGWYVRKSGSQLITGALYEYAEWPAWQAMSGAEPDHLIDGLKRYAAKQIQMGITTVQFMNFDFPTSAPYYIKANLPQRVRIIPFPGTTKNGRSLQEWKSINHHPTPLIYVSGIKYLLDGTPFEEASFNRQPYPGKPTWYGRTDMPVDTIRQILKEAYTSQTQLMMHIVGDSTLSLVLSLMKQTGNEAVWRSKRVRFEHNASAHASAKEIQAIHDMGIIMAHTPKYGHGNHIQSFLDKGILVSVSPDGTTNPFWDIMVMTSQQNESNENTTVEKAVIAYTKTNAYAEFTEKEKGTLMPGMLADLVVLSQDIFTIPAQQLPATRSVLTLVGGKIVYP